MLNKLNEEKTDRHSCMISFSKNTKLVFTLTALALIILIISTLLEIKSGRYIAICILLAAFCINYQETAKLYNKVPNIFSTPLRNTLVLSSLLCASLFALFIYICYISVF